MYHTKCLQTGENVLLLTVFVNIRDSSTNKDNVFTDAKAVLKRYIQFLYTTLTHCTVFPQNYVLICRRQLLTDGLLAIKFGKFEKISEK